MLKIKQYNDLCDYMKHNAIYYICIVLLLFIQSRLCSGVVSGIALLMSAICCLYLMLVLYQALLADIKITNKISNSMSNLTRCKFTVQ